VRYTVTIKARGTQSWMNVEKEEVRRILYELPDRLNPKEKVIIEIEPENNL